MNGLLGTLLPLAIAVTISPIPIIAEILLLFSKKPVTNAGAYLAGFVVGVGIVVGAFVAVAGLSNLSPGSNPSTGAAAVDIGLGVLLAVAAIRKFRSRSNSDTPAAMPKWMDGIAAFSTTKSLGIGFAIGALNPKNLAVGFAAAISISSASLSATSQILSVVFYVVIAAVGVAAPLVVMVALGSRAQAILDGWKAWLTDNNAVVMAVLFAVFATVLTGKGIAAL